MRQGDFDRLRRRPCLSPAGMRVGYSINIEHARWPHELVPSRSLAVARHVREFCRQVRADVRDVRFGRGESDAFVAGVEAAAHQRRVATPTSRRNGLIFRSRILQFVAPVRCKYSDFSLFGESRAGKIALAPPQTVCRTGVLERGALKLSDFFANVLFFRSFVP